LQPASRQRFVDWMIGTRTGLQRIRAGLPQGWRAADKTGTGARGSTNDIAVIWPPNGPPIIVAAYLTESEAPEAERVAVLAGVGRLVAAAA
jgi:beta-lactamase class A